MDVAERILQALRSVYDPCCREQGISIVDMGLIRDIRVDGEAARVELVLTSGWCPFAVHLLAEVREQVEALTDVVGATVEIAWDEAWTSERLSPDAQSKLRFLPAPRTVLDRGEYLAAHLTHPTEQGRPLRDDQ